MIDNHNEVVLLGAGITGLAAASELGESATVFERSERPGGLVKSHCFNDGYWFDHVLHIFHCNKPDILKKVNEIVGPLLAECPPVAWIETAAGVVRYPFQLNLGSLSTEAKINCVKDFSHAFYQQKDFSGMSYGEYLTNAFGKTMCDLFYYPYNEKLWKLPLDEISTNGQLWNLHRPSFDEILRGLVEPNVLRETYNTNAFYPRPEINAPLRGMEILSQGFSRKVKKLNLSSEIVHVNPRKRTVSYARNGQVNEYGYDRHCLSTIPLPALMHLCEGVPDHLLRDVKKLKWVKVLSIALSIKGARPVNPGCWRYFTDSEAPFTRLVFMTEFDTNNAPEEGWGLLVEIPLSADDPSALEEPIQEKAIKAIKKAGFVSDDHEIIGIHKWLADPAYVVFTPETRQIIDHCHEYLAQFDITSGGRYGSWEYSSMSRNIEDGFEIGKKLRG
ncbi:NAD(P)/FAD-dependent oxidoreductase [Dyadobacter sp. CY343]|uniref:protoporphyrinogen/coproporphyrinogen oxidase n=1 Tax=Dyadobacter sp. CY343 TaxID=2907299 RepID=UPI001F3E6307|nr:NAD(P)-binding protein [Dyadobacter sp. CY343]MCE7061625.1 NAD(P)-binding protein [Dyadobacter sp. CY343]